MREARVEICKFLVDKGADVNAIETNFMTNIYE